MSQRKGSITPTTFNAGHFIPIEGSHAQSESLEVTKSITFLQKKKQELTQASSAVITGLKAATDGIIDHSRLARSEKELKDFAVEFDAKIDRLGKYQQLVDVYEKFLKANSGLELYCREEYVNSSSSVFRFGINVDPLTEHQSRELASIFDKTAAIKSGSVSSAASRKAMDYPHILHPLEVFQIKEAINHCTTVGAKVGVKTVIVDIFERNEDGSINIGGDKKPGIHSIVLYKQGNQVLVIDPSNSDFSKHIAYNADVIYGYDSPGQISVPYLPIKIYSPYGPVGPNPSEYRDCTDIAIKLAFGLNKHVVPIDMRKLRELSVVQEVTNQVDINDCLVFDAKKTPARMRQATDDMTRDKIEKLMVSIDRQSDCAKSYKRNDLEKKMAQDCKACFQVEYPYDKYADSVAALEALHKSNIGLIGQMMEDSTT